MEYRGFALSMSLSEHILTHGVQKGMPDALMKVGPNFHCPSQLKVTSNENYTRSRMHGRWRARVWTMQIFSKVPHTWHIWVDSIVELGLLHITMQHPCRFIMFPRYPKDLRQCQSPFLLTQRTLEILDNNCSRSKTYSWKPKLYLDRQEASIMN